jgi:hypothetical protein
MLFRLMFFCSCALATIAAGAQTPAADADYAWPNLTDFFRQLTGRIGGPVKVYRLTIDRDGKVNLWIQDQQRPDLVDSYQYDHGTLRDPVPVKFERYPTIEAVDHHVIELTTIDFPRLPAMLATARSKLGMPDGRVSSVQLERGDSSGMLTYSDIPIWTFHIDTPRHDGRVEFGLDGRVLDVDKD